MEWSRALLVRLYKEGDGELNSLSLTRPMLPSLELGLNRYRISLRSGMSFEQGLFGR